MRLALPLLLILSLATAALAVEGGNPRKGRYLFRTTCLSCHQEEAKAGALDTRSKTQAQWDRFFAKDRHRAAPAGLEALSEKERLDLRQYVNDYALDTDPGKCGACWESK
ncbi:MAG: cytochrome C oxidase Cbb3 [Desulfuromonas sp.]|uniref:c-type cytochrome n=1 Tax=Desulfuromonas sp. TaxID=892 RepID=UPI000CAEC6A3|nr:cytochrome c [Desulfuromonas sp.]PLX84858.1 MAG: cytochrome C oxidase Cbb3 [Desulfuromonas sp.]